MPRIEEKFQEYRTLINSKKEKGISRVKTFTAQNKSIFYTVGAFSVAFTMVGGIITADNEWLAPDRKARNQAYSERLEAEKIAKEADFKQTAGANFLRGKSNSMAVTLRDSASLAPSRVDFLNGVWDRIHRETGCEIGSTAYLAAIPGFLWGQKEPETYALTLENCPPAKVNSVQ